MHEGPEGGHFAYPDPAGAEARIHVEEDARVEGGAVYGRNVFEVARRSHADADAGVDVDGEELAADVEGGHVVVDQHGDRAAAAHVIAVARRLESRRELAVGLAVVEHPVGVEQRGGGRFYVGQLAPHFQLHGIQCSAAEAQLQRALHGGDGAQAVHIHHGDAQEAAVADGVVGQILQVGGREVGNVGIVGIHGGGHAEGGAHVVVHPPLEAGEAHRPQAEEHALIGEGLLGTHGGLVQFRDGGRRTGHEVDPRPVARVERALGGHAPGPGAGGGPRGGIRRGCSYPHAQLGQPVFEVGLGPDHHRGPQIERSRRELELAVHLAREAGAPVGVVVVDAQHTVELHHLHAELEGNL